MGTRACVECSGDGFIQLCECGSMALAHDDNGFKGHVCAACGADKKPCCRCLGTGEIYDRGRLGREVDAHLLEVCSQVDAVRDTQLRAQLEGRSFSELCRAYLVSRGPGFADMSLEGNRMTVTVEPAVVEFGGWCRLWSKGFRAQVEQGRRLRAALKGCG